MIALKYIAAMLVVVSILFVASGVEEWRLWRSEQPKDGEN